MPLPSCIAKRRFGDYTVAFAMALTTYILANTVECNDILDCTVNVSVTEEAQVGFLTPENNEGEFLACFSDILNASHTLTLYFHEYHLPQTNVIICRIDFVDFIDDYTEGDFNHYCKTYQPMLCNFSMESNDSLFIKIILPARQHHVHHPPEVFSDRPLFNITYDLRPKEMAPSIVNPSTQNYLQFCNLNGVATLYKNQDGKYSFGCDCRGSSAGDRCELGGICTETSKTDLCHRGQCRYQGGQAVCICERDYFGQYCEYHKNSLTSMTDRTCSNRWNCDQKCHLFNSEPYCSCWFGYTPNGSHCISEDLVWDVTVICKNCNSTFFQNKTLKILEENAIPPIETTMSPNNNSSELKVHFIVNDTQKNTFLQKEKWEEAFATSVYFEAQPRFETVKLEQITVSKTEIILQCVAIGSLPLLFKWYKDQHLVLLHNVTSCNQTSKIKYEKLIATIMKDDNYDRACRMELMVKSHDPMVDYGPYTCEVTDGENSIPKSSTLVNYLTSPLKIYISREVTTVEKNSNLSLLCTTRGNWIGGDNFVMSWEVSPLHAIEFFSTHSQYWNGSRIKLYNIKESLNLTCAIKERENCRVKEFSVTAKVIVVSVGGKYCSRNSNLSVSWPVLPIGEIFRAPCPSGFHGLCSRKCESNGEGYAVWTLPDCSNCIYAPLMEIVENPEVILQGRGYPFAIQDADSIANKFLGILQSRRDPQLPDEIFVIINTLKKIIYAHRNPVSLYTYAGIVQHLSGYQCTIKCGWSLRDTTREFIRLTLNRHLQSKSVVEFRDVGAHVEQGLTGNSSFIMHISRNYPCESVEVKISGLEDGLKKGVFNVGVFIYTHPRLLLDNITSTRRNLQIGELPVDLSIAPLVEIVAEISNKELHYEEDCLVVNLAYNNHLTPKNELLGRERACGQLKFKADGTFDWDLSLCSNIIEDRILKCQCKGQGLFGLFMKASLTSKLDMERDNMSVIAVTCCAVLLAIVLLSVIIVMRWSPSLSLKLPAILRSKEGHLCWQEYPSTENSNGKMNYKPVATVSSEEVVFRHTWCEDHVLSSETRSFSDAIPSKSDIQFTKDKAHDLGNNGYTQVQAMINVNETDSVYMDMNPSVKEAKVDTLKRLNEAHKYVNIADSSCTPEQLMLGTDSIIDNNKWVLSAKGCRNTYLPMMGMTTTISCQENINE